MRLLIIRHGDPDYGPDCLTEKGKREAELLAARISKMDLKAVYLSPKGRAKETAEYCLRAMNRKEDAVYEWLREFEGRCVRPDRGSMTLCWDWLPQDWTAHPMFYDKDLWLEDEIIKNSNVEEEYRMVCEGLDSVLARHGYERDGNCYRAVKPNNDTIAFFCHFGVESVMLGHMLGISPMILWHATAAAPTSVTTVYTEERRPGIASFRVASYGDISHLYVGGEEPSFSARFCECYDNEQERHD